MKLSTKGRYGLKAMLDLAVNSGDGQVSLKSIAERQEISENYLEQIFAVLKKEGLVKSIRGSQGGYVLSQEAAKITAGDILRALEGSLAPVDCVLEEDPAECERSQYCVTRIIWARIRDSINQVVDSISLQDLVEDYDRSQQKGEDDIYYI